MKEIEIIQRNNIEVIDSRLVAERLEINHKSLLDTIRNHKETIESHFERVAFETEALETRGGLQNITVAYLTEDQSIFIATLSRNSEAVVKFKAELVKAFRKYRELKPAQFEYNLPKTKVEAIRALLEAEIIIEKQNEQLLLAEPKIAFFDNVVKTEDCFDLSQVAAMLKIPNGKKFYGRNQIFEKLRELKYLQPDSTLPYKSKIDLGYFKVIETSYNQGVSVKATTKTLVTQKGLIHLQKHLSSTEW